MISENIKFIILGIIIWIIIWYLIAKIYYWIQISKHRKDAVDRSKSVISGQVYEKIAPLLPEFPYNFKDLVFIWKWIDYIVFDWLAEWKVDQIVFLEIKSWKSNLNANERTIKSAIDNKKVYYEIMKF